MSTANKSPVTRQNRTRCHGSDTSRSSGPAGGGGRHRVRKWRLRRHRFGVNSQVPGGLADRTSVTHGTENSGAVPRKPVRLASLPVGSPPSAKSLVLGTRASGGSSLLRPPPQLARGERGSPATRPPDLRLREAGRGPGALSTGAWGFRVTDERCRVGVAAGTLALPSVSLSCVSKVCSLLSPRVVQTLKDI